MNHKREIMNYTCSHDPTHPDHLTCLPGDHQEYDKLPFHKKRYRRYYHHGRKYYLAHRIVDSVLVSLIIISTAALIYVHINGPLSYNALRLSFNNDHLEIESGRMIDTSIEITNTSSGRLLNPSLSLVLPPHFQLSEPTAARVNGNRASLELKPTLLPKEKIIIPLKGIVVGTKGERQTLQASVRAEHERNEWVFFSDSEASLLIGDSAIEVRAELPKILIPHNPFGGAIIIENRSSQVIENIVAQLVIPPELTLVSSRLGDFAKGISIDSLAAHEQLRIPLNGELKEYRKRLDPLSVLVYLERNGDRITQRQAEFLLTPATPALDIELRISGNQPYLDPGTPRTVEVLWSNRSRDAITDIRISVAASGFGINEQSLQSPLASTLRPLERTWTRNTYGGLASLDPQSADSLSFTLTPHKDHDTNGINATDTLSGTLNCSASYRINGFEQRSSCTTIPFQVGTVASIHAHARFFSQEGDQIGHGPFPPRANSATTYMIFLVASSSIHPLKQALVSAHWSPFATTPTFLPVQYGYTSINEKERTITWDIGTLPSLISHANQSTEIAFMLPFKLREDSAQSELLLTNITLTGIDTISNEQVMSHAPDITSVIAPYEKR